jgi:hypothetical protein
LRGRGHGEVSQLLILSLMKWSPKTCSAPAFLFSFYLHGHNSLFHHLFSYHMGAKTLLSSLVLISITETFHITFFQDHLVTRNIFHHHVSGLTGHQYISHHFFINHVVTAYWITACSSVSSNHGFISNSPPTEKSM